MSNYNSLKATIDANIKQNGRQEITGQILNSVLNQMVTTLGAGYQFAGVATTATNPGTPDAKVFYIANGKGTYTNFGGLEVTEDDVVVLYYDTEWHKVATGIASNEKLTELGKKIDLINNKLGVSSEYSRLNGYVIYPNGLVNTLEGYSICYLPVKAGENVIIKISQSETKNLHYGFSQNVPSQGFYVTLYADSPLSGTSIEKTISVENDGYLCVNIYHETFVSIGFFFSESIIKDSLSETTKGYALDATQGKVLNDKIDTTKEVLDGSLIIQNSLPIDSKVEGKVLTTGGVMDGDGKILKYDISNALNAKLLVSGTFNINTANVIVAWAFYKNGVRDSYFKPESTYNTYNNLEVSIPNGCDELWVTNLQPWGEPTIKAGKYGHLSEIQEQINEIETQIQDIPKNEKIYNVKKSGDIVGIACKYSATQDLCMIFTYCMANNLFTLWASGLLNNSDEAPKASVDPYVEFANRFKHISALSIETDMVPITLQVNTPDHGEQSIGGNHTIDNGGNILKTAKTDSYKVLIDGVEKDSSANYDVLCKEVYIYVENTLFDPNQYTAETTEILTVPFVKQYCGFIIGKYGVEYTERNKVIENNSGITLLRDYAGASTFDAADYCFTPQGIWDSWVQKTDSLQGTMSKTGYPNFRNIIQKRTSDNAYESLYLRLFEKGIDRDTLIFHKNANNFKLYHGVIGGTEISATLNYEYSFSLIFTWGLKDANVVDGTDYILFYNEINGTLIYFIYFLNAYTGTINIPLKYADYNVKIIEKDETLQVSNGMNVGGVSVIANTNQRLVFELIP